MLFELLIGLLILFWIFIGGFCLVFNVLRHSVMSLSPPGKMQCIAAVLSDCSCVVTICSVKRFVAQAGPRTDPILVCMGSETPAVRFMWYRLHVERSRPRLRGAVGSLATLL